MPEIKDAVLSWLAAGRVGSSSKTMALAACGLPNDGDYPHDPDDLNRCLLMLKAVPDVRQHFDKIEALGAVWARLIKRWPEIEASFLDEVGLNWSKAKASPATYKLMREVICKEPGVVHLGGGMSFRTR